MEIFLPAPLHCYDCIHRWNDTRTLNTIPTLTLSLTLNPDPKPNLDPKPKPSLKSNPLLLLLSRVLKQSLLICSLYSTVKC